MPRDIPPLSRILLVKLRQNVVGAFASRLAELLEALDVDSPGILDFAPVTSIDGYGINVIAETLTRGVSLYLVAVRGKVRRMFRQARAISEDQFVSSIHEALEAIDRDYQPDEAVDVERRSSPRVRAHIPVEVVMTIDGRRVPTEGIIKDISEGGIYVELLQQLADVGGDEFDLSSALDLRFALPDVSYPCLLEGSAVHASAASANLYCGVKFREISYLDEDAIRVFLYRHDPDRRAGSS
jgi:anti-anti-sigma regulatory factor